METGNKIPTHILLFLMQLAERALMIWPSQRLKDNTRYIVALRKLENKQGELVKPSPAFLALRWVPLAVIVLLWGGVFVPINSFPGIPFNAYIISSQFP